MISRIIKAEVCVIIVITQPEALIILDIIQKPNSIIVLDRTSVQKRYYCTLIASAAEITRRFQDCENYPTRFDQSRERK